MVVICYYIHLNLILNISSTGALRKMKMLRDTKSWDLTWHTLLKHLFYSNFFKLSNVIFDLFKNVTVRFQFPFQHVPYKSSFLTSQQETKLNKLKFNSLSWIHQRSEVTRQAVSLKLARLVNSGNMYGSAFLNQKPLGPLNSNLGELREADGGLAWELKILGCPV